MAFVRRNALIITTSFTAADGTLTQPSNVVCLLNYKSLENTPQTAQVTLAYNAATNVWSGVWDSSVAGRGLVSWVVVGTGTLQAADEGVFEIQANVANS